MDVAIEQFEEHKEVGPVALVGRGRSQHQVAGVAGQDAAEVVGQRLPVFIAGHVVGLVNDDQVPRHVGQRGLHVGLAGEGGGGGEARRGGPELEVAAQAVAGGGLALG